MQDITNKQASKPRRPNQGGLMEHQMNLEKVIGNTIKSGASVAVNPATGDVAYPAGCVVVFYSPKRHRQFQYLSCINNRPLSCLCFSQCGRYLAAGEGGRQPSVLVWDVKTGLLQTELKGHSFSVNAVQFSSDGKLLASVGSQVDGRLNLWQWRTGALVGNARVVCEVKGLAFSHDSTTLVTAGTKGHLKHWAVDSNALLTGKCKPLKGRRAVVEGGPPMSYDYVDVCFSVTSKNAAETYALSSDGFLLFFDATRVLEKWVNLKSLSVKSLSATDRFVACACANGLVRMFHPTSLEYVCTLPKPPPFQPPGANGKPSSPHNQASSWPDAIAVSLTQDSQRAVCAFADRTLLVWDVRDPAKICRCRALHAHSASVWDIEFASDEACASAGVPTGSFFSCSSDGTLRLWSLPPAEEPPQAAPTRDLRSVLKVGGELGAQQEGAMASDPTGGGVRCLRVSPDGGRVACGDRSGNLHVYKLSAGGVMEPLAMVEAHDGEVMCVEFCEDLVATCSRDRLVHVFDTKSDYDLVRTFDEHSAAVTSLKFAAGGSRLVSCGADKTCVFRTVERSPEGVVSVSGVRRSPAGGGTLYDMATTSGGSVFTVGQDKQLTEWDAATGNQRKGYPTESETTLRVRVNAAGTHALTSCSDRGVRLYDLAGGGACSVAVHGHSEPVTGLAFSPDHERAVSASGDGCIFVWRLPKASVRAMVASREVNDAAVALKRKVPTVSELSAVKVANPKGSQHEVQKSFLSSLLDESLRAAGLSPTAAPDKKGPSNNPPATASVVANEVRKPAVPSGDMVIEDMEDDDPAASPPSAPAREGSEARMEEWGQPEAVGASGRVEEEEDFVVARSEGVLASRGVLASKGVLSEGVGVVGAAEPDASSDDDDEQPSPGDAKANASPSPEKKVDEALDERTVEVDPRSSLRLSMSVSHQLKRQIQNALASGGYTPPESADVSAANQSVLTPRSTAQSSVQATPDRREHVECRSATSQARNQKLAGEIEAMRHRLQAMGMCVEEGGAAAPTPCDSAVPSVAQSPAKPVGPPRRPVSAQTQQPQARAKDHQQQPQQPQQPSKPQTAPAPSQQPSPAPPAAASPPPAPTTNSQTPTTESVSGASGSKRAEKQPSLFAKMRSAAVVKAAERAEGQIASSAGEVYHVVNEDAKSLAEERARMKEEAKRKVEEELEQRKQADDEARKEKFRGAKEEADAIRERLRELERRKAEAGLAKAKAAEKQTKASEEKPQGGGDEEQKARVAAEAQREAEAQKARVEAEASKKKREVEEAKKRAEAADAAVRLAESEEKARHAAVAANVPRTPPPEAPPPMVDAAAPGASAAVKGPAKTEEEGEEVRPSLVKAGSGRKMVPLPSKVASAGVVVASPPPQERAEEGVRAGAQEEAKGLMEMPLEPLVQSDAPDHPSQHASVDDVTVDVSQSGDASASRDESLAAQGEGGALGALGQGVMDWAAELGVKVVSPLVIHQGVVGTVAEDSCAEGAETSLGSEQALEEDSESVAAVPGAGLDRAGGGEVDDGGEMLLEQCSVQVGVSAAAEVLDTPSGAGEMLDDSIQSVASSVDLGEPQSRLLRSSMMATTDGGDPSVRQSVATDGGAASVRQSIISIPEDGCCVFVSPQKPPAMSAPSPPNFDSPQNASPAAQPTPPCPDSPQASMPLPQSSPTQARLTDAAAALVATPPVADTPAAREGGSCSGRETPPPPAAARPPAPHPVSLDSQSRPSTSASQLPPLHAAPHGVLTPDVSAQHRPWSSAVRSAASAASSVLLPAREADPNHPLRPGTAGSPLDDTCASSVVSAADQSFADKTRFDDLQSADALFGSVQASLDALNVARASNNRFAVGHIVESLREAQLRIAEALGEAPPQPPPSRAPSEQRAPFGARGAGGDRESADVTAASSCLPSARSSVADARMGTNLSGISSVGGGSEIDMESVLERYSDRLVEMVTRKMEASMSFDGPLLSSRREKSRGGE